MDEQVPRPPPARLRVGLADRHRPMREALRSLLEREPGIEITATASSWGELTATLDSRQLDVLLLDHALLESSLADSIGALLAADPGLQVIVLAMDCDDPLRQVALSSGAQQYLLKDSAPSELIGAVLAAGGSNDGRPSPRTTTEATPVDTPHAVSNRRS